MTTTSNRQWKKSSRWRQALKGASEREDYRGVFRLECLADNINPFGGFGNIKSIGAALRTESWRMWKDIYRHQFIDLGFGAMIRESNEEFRTVKWKMVDEPSKP